MWICIHYSLAFLFTPSVIRQTNRLWVKRFFVLSFPGSLQRHWFLKCLISNGGYAFILLFSYSVSLSFSFARSLDSWLPHPPLFCSCPLWRQISRFLRFPGHKCSLHQIFIHPDFQAFWGEFRNSLSIFRSAWRCCASFSSCLTDIRTTCWHVFRA